MAEDESALRCQCQPPFHRDQIVTPLSALDATENMGSKGKGWLTDPATKRRWLYKKTRSRGGFVRGEDWAECLVHVAAQYLCLPSACIALAIVNGERGIVSRSVLSHSRLHSGPRQRVVIPFRSGLRQRPWTR